VTSVSVVAATVGVWTKATAFDTDRYVDLVVPAAYARHPSPRCRRPSEGGLGAPRPRNVAFTMDTHSHAIPALEAKAAQMVADLVFGDAESEADVGGET
jgi:hypothetical protein